MDKRAKNDNILPLDKVSRGISKAFTLTELIVVVTILAILGLISFISIQGFTIDARDAKRISDVRSLITKITIENNKGIDYSDLINKEEGYKDNKLTINSTPQSGSQNTGNSINWNVLRENGDNFKDPLTGNPYPFAFAEGNANGVGYSFIQLAYTEEKTGATKLVGNYYEMQPGDSPSLFTNESGNGERIPNDYIIDDDIQTPPNNCERNPDFNGYDVPAINDGETTTATRTETIDNGQANYSQDFTCDNGNFETSGTEQTLTPNCDTTYIPQGNTCIKDECAGNIPDNAESNALSQSYGTSWIYNIQPGVCTYKCAETFHTENGGTSCISDEETGTCTGNIPTHATKNTGDTYTRTWTTSRDKPVTTARSNGGSICGYSCSSGRTGDTCNLQIINGECGKGGGDSAIATAPTSSLCTKGTASTVTNSANNWTWSCSGINEGTNATGCSRPRAYCATQPSYANATFTEGTPTSSNQAWVKGASNCGFSCKSGRTGDTCSLQIINGVCGNGGGTSAIVTAPTSSLCTKGTASTVANSTNTWTWSCSGINEGTNATGCSRPRAYCATKPNYANATFTTGTPTSSNQAWQMSSSSACYYQCTDGYTGNNCKCYRSITYSGNDIIIEGCLVDGGDIVTVTIADKNLGATAVYSGTETSAVRGKYYQRGNNYGFPNSGTVSYSSSQIDASSYGPGTTNGYYNNSVFRGMGTFEWDSSRNKDLWGSYDDTNSRQGPCPTGRHIPHYIEWSYVFKIWCMYRGGSNDSCLQPFGGYKSWSDYSSAPNVTLINFKNDLKLPLAGYRHYTENTPFNGGIRGSYWSVPSFVYSSTNTNYAYYLQFNSSMVSVSSYYYNTSGFSLRCFKN